MSEEAPPPPPPPPIDPTPDPISAGTPAIGFGSYAGPPPDKDSITMGMLCHLLGIFTYFIGPLIIWLIKKETSPFVDDQGKEALNFQIVASIASAACFLACCVPPVVVLLISAVQITRIVFSIIATVQANQGIAYRYPLTIRLIK
jgi:uncharacterized Tic20 family protein